MVGHNGSEMHRGRAWLTHKTEVDADSVGSDVDTLKYACTSIIGEYDLFVGTACSGADFAASRATRTRGITFFLEAKYVTRKEETSSPD